MCSGYYPGRAGSKVCRYTTASMDLETLGSIYRMFEKEGTKPWWGKNQNKVCRWRWRLWGLKEEAHKRIFWWESHVLYPGCGGRWVTQVEESGKTPCIGVFKMYVFDYMKNLPWESHINTYGTLVNDIHVEAFLGKAYCCLYFTLKCIQKKKIRQINRWIDG